MFEIDDHFQSCLCVGTVAITCKSANFKDNIDTVICPCCLNDRNQPSISYSHACIWRD